MKFLPIVLCVFTAALVSSQFGCSRHGDADGRMSCPRGTVRSGDECLEEGGVAPETEEENTTPTTPAEPGEGETPETPTEEPIVLTIITPETESSVEEDVLVTFEGTLQGLEASEDYETLSLVWSSHTDGVIHSEDVTTDATSTFSIENLSPGIHTIIFEARADGESIATTTIHFGVCGWEFIEHFDEELADDEWKTYGHAYRDNRGWIELTSNLTSRRGHLFNIGQALQPGNTRLRFDISTGQCDFIGNCADNFNAADGFAASVYNVESEAALDALIASTQNGGGLGYHIASTTNDVESFHIEFDTWYNGAAMDPTAEDHIAIHLNANAHDAEFFAEVPNLEDNHWHDIQLTIEGITVTVALDGTEIISGDIPGFDFKGGFIGFSGTTGAYTNFHRIDNLRQQPQCTF